MKLSRRALLIGGGSLAASSSLANPDAALKRVLGIGEPPPEKDENFAGMTKESEESVIRGTEFLMQTRHNDGGYGMDIGLRPDYGCTALVGLSLLAQGNTARGGPKMEEVRKITSFLAQAVEKGDVTRTTGTQIQGKIGHYAHSFFVLLYLSQILGECPDPAPVLKGVTKLANTVTRAQSVNGDWGGPAWAPILGTVTGWVSLLGAKDAGMEVKASAKKTAEFLIKTMRSKLSQPQRNNWMHTLYKNASGIRVLYAMDMEDEDIAKKAWKDLLLAVTSDNTAFAKAGGEEYLAFHLVTETMLKRGGRDWLMWFPNLRDKIIDVQNRDGSWTGRHCITSRTFCTAAATLVLSAPNRYLPMSQP